MKSLATIAPAIIVNREGVVWRVQASGDWDCNTVHLIDENLRTLETDSYQSIEIDTSQIRRFDTSGAWLIERFRTIALRTGKEFSHVDQDSRRVELAEVVRPDQPDEVQSDAPIEGILTRSVSSIGKSVVNAGKDFILGCHLIGASIQGSQMKVGKRGGLRLTSIIHQLDHMALRAVPVVAVMSVLIGAIIAQQGAFQLKYYGEELLTVNLVGILHLREIAVLLTAIMVAGRTGSAITAQIGMMKIREEVDALQVIGLNPVGVLILPRLIALIIAMPLLTFVSGISGLGGAMLVSYMYVGISPTLFIQALQNAIDLSTIFSGLIKAPFMAVIIGIVAAVEGLKVGGSAESLGQHTTASVVRSIFCVIVVDGMFAIFYAAIDY